MTGTTSEDRSYDTGDIRDRRAPRHNVELRVRFRCNSSARQLLFGQGADVSEFGMGMYAATELPVGALLDLELLLPYSQVPLGVRATVRNRHGFHYGLEFDPLSAYQKQMLLRTCTALALLQSGT